MKRPAIALLLLLTSLLNLNCGYRLAGRGRSLPAGAKTIVVPDFTNETSRLEAGRFVSDAIRREFIKRSRLRLCAETAEADLLLEGRISAFETSPVSQTDRGPAAAIDVRITIAVRLIDLKKNELFYEGSGLLFRETLETEAGDFFSQEAGALDRLAAKFASVIVTPILENF